MRRAFNFYRSYWEVANELSETDRLKFYDAVMLKQFTGEEPKLDGMVKFAYLSQKHSIDRQVKGYEDKTKDPLVHPSVGGWQGGWQGGSVDPSAQEKEEEKEEEKEKGKEEGKEKVVVPHWNQDIGIDGYSKNKKK
jgi:hypothetical protein